MNNKLNIIKCRCGGEPYLTQDHFSAFSFGDWKIVCEKCGMQTGWTKTKEEAVEVWDNVMSITGEEAVEYLQNTGWMENHDYRLIEIGKEMALEAFYGR